MTKVELTVSSKPLTVETLNDANSSTPISPSNLFTLESNIVMPPTGQLSQSDLYCKE